MVKPWLVSIASAAKSAAERRQYHPGVLTGPTPTQQLSSGW
jgi:hypothetical protein